MRWLIPHAAWRTWFSIGGFGVLLALEQWRPFKPRVDLVLRRYARNIFLSVTNQFILELTLTGAAVAWMAWLAGRGWGLMNVLRLPTAASAFLSVLFFDLATYAFHKAYHEVPLMWRLHRVHHADLDLDVTSASRFHAAEILLSTLYRMALMPLWGPSLASVAVFETALLAAAQVQHSNLRLPGDWDRRLRAVFVTPDMHRVHHSVVKEHTNSNYSTIFSWWDRLFGTYNVEGIDQRSLVIGLPEYRRAEDVTLGRLLVLPAGPACGAESAPA